jgi:thiamine transport system permease protein
LLNKLYYFFVLILGLIIFLPIFGILTKIEFNSLHLFEFIQSKYNLRLVYITFIQAFLSSLISCVLALPFAISLFRRKKKLINRILISLCGYSFVLPSILIVYSVIGIFGANGALNKITNLYDVFNIRTIFGLQGILIAHILLNTPFAVRIFVQNLNSIPKKYIEVAKSMNFSFWQNYLYLEWPIIRQNFYSIFSIIFILCFLSFAIVMALGGGPRYSTLEVAIYQSIFFELNFNKAIIISFIQIAICSFLLIIGFLSLKGSNYYDIQTDNFEYLFNKNKLISLIDFLIIAIFSLFFFSPIIFILINFLQNIINTQFFINKLFFNAFINSMALSLSSGLMVTVSGLIISLILVSIRSKLFHQQVLFFLTSTILVISPIIISLGYYIILGNLRYFNFINYITVILINCIFILPFSIIVFFTKLKNIFINFNDIKESFRINDIDFFKIIFPLIKKNILFVFSFASALSFGDFTVISFFKTENFQTMPSLLYKLISTYRFEEATFVAGIILIISLLIYLIFDNIFYTVSPDKNI